MRGDSDRKRVVITGVGLVTPLGTGVDKTWEGLCAGRSGVSEITRFDAGAFQTRIAGEVTDFNAEDFLPRKEARRVEPFIAYSLAAAQMAVDDAALDVSRAGCDRVGVSTGCGLGGLYSVEKTVEVIEKKGPGRVSPFFIPMLIGNMAAGMISMRFSAKGPNLSVATACAAGAHAVGEAYRLVQTGTADFMITGGVESVITPVCISGFNAMKALSTRNDDPKKASRPFDSGRDGFVVGEGAGIMVLESLESALDRGADIYAEICGYGLNGDGYHMTAPAPDGEGMAACMKLAIEDAGIAPSDIGYVNAHGTSTKLNDLYETMAIKNVFGKAAFSVPISSTKSMTGHLLGGAGGVETVFTALTVKNGIIPPTINFDTPDENCNLDYVPHRARKKDVTYAMTNSFGFGGTNASLVLKKL